MIASSAFDDAALFMDELFPLKEEDAVTSQAATTTMDADMIPASSLELVQLLGYDDVGDVAFLDGPFAMTSDAVYSPSASDDLSDAMTDAASEMSSPPPSFDDDRQPTPVSPSDYASYAQTTTFSHGHNYSTVGASTTHTPRTLAKQLPTPVSPPAAVGSTPLPVPTASMLPFAFPVACFPPMNLNQKRPLPDVLPNTLTESDPSLSKKSKREIRQMKNRESANRSRLRRKAQLSDLSSEVDDLMRKQHELQNTIAALHAENKSLHDQNSFLRSLVAMSRGVKLPPVPSFTAQNMVPLSRPMAKSSLSDLESGNNSSFHDDDEEEEDDDDDDDDDEVAMVVPTTKKRKAFSRTVASVSATGLGLCASVFGLTILADSENGAAQSSHIRRSGRVLHSLPSTAANPGCSPGAIQSMMERGWEVLTSSWAMVSSSELAYGVLLNVLSFVIIMGLYHCFTQYIAAQKSNKKAFRWASVKNNKRATANAAANAKRRSVSWQDVRLQTAAQDEASTSRVQVFT